MDGKYPQSIYVMNILNAAGKNKDEAQGFSVYFFLNQMDQIEVNVYAPNRDGNAVMLAQGVIEGVPVTAEPYQPITVRVRVEKKRATIRFGSILCRSTFTTAILSIPQRITPHICPNSA